MFDIQRGTGDVGVQHVNTADMMKHWTTFTFAACVNISCAQTTGCQAQLQLSKGIDSASTYAMAQLQFQGTGSTKRNAAKELMVCVFSKTSKPVVFDEGLIDDLCACPADGLRLSIVRVERVRRDSPLDRVRLKLIYKRDN